MSIIAGIGWLGVTTSVLCSLYSSFLQQKLKNASVHALIAQSSPLTLLKRYGTLTSYVSPPSNDQDNITLVSFSDASHEEVSIQLYFMVGLLFCQVNKGSVTNRIYLSSEKSGRPVRSTTAAKILSAVEALNDVLSIGQTLSIIIDA